MMLHSAPGFNFKEWHMTSVVVVVFLLVSSHPARANDTTVRTTIGVVSEEILESPLFSPRGEG